MPQYPNYYSRILAIDPSTKGFGFALIEGKGRLIDWGVARLYSSSGEEFLARVETMIDRYRPSGIVVEDLSSTRRGERAKRRIETAIGYARLREVHPSLASRGEVRACLGLGTHATKHETATRITEVFPELEMLLPPKRKPWMSEDERMNVFDAVGLALSGVSDWK
jgi:Holliday junction resolvasome RuvABC endonuclease subunit